MSEAVYNPFSGDEDNAPRRPSTDDAGGVDKVQKGPVSAEKPSAAEWNQRSLIIQALAKMVEVVDCTVKGQVSPYIVANRFRCPSDVMTSDDFAAVRNGAGDYSVTWDTTLMPATSQSLSRFVALNSLVVRYTSVVISGGLRFVMYNAAGTETDSDFRFGLG